jgi:cyclase
MKIKAGRCVRPFGATSKLPNLRLIARLDIKGSDLIKSIQLEGVRKLGNPGEFARRYYEQGADEILYMDAVASLYNRQKLLDIVKSTAETTFVPITVGGGMRSVDDVRQVLRAGADKIAINSAATLRPELISEIAEKFGSQCVVLSIEAKRSGPGKWEAYRDSGREHTGLDAVEWAQRAAELGAGEILVTSVDQEGTRQGFDIELLKAISSTVDLPMIASGGMGNLRHIDAAVRVGGADAVAMAHVLHYAVLDLPRIRTHAKAEGFHVRTLPQ